MSGGPMFYISRGLKMPWLGFLFAVFAAVAAFGIGDMVQSNSVAEAVKHAWSIPTWLTGLVLTVCTGAVLLGGIKSIARVSTAIVPVMIIFYMFASAWVLLLHLTEIPGIVGLIFARAFTPQAAGGGFLGATVQQAVRYGVARGIFSNESGLGSSPIAAAAAKTKEPATQALVSMTQTFIDTLFVNTGTALVILLSGEWRSVMTGPALSMAAFSAALPNSLGPFVVPAGIVLFAYSTLIGWGYYGEKAVEYLIGERAIFSYRVVFTALVFVGAVVQLDLVWSFADVMNGLMAWPNLVALLGLSGVVAEETRRYFSALRNEKKGNGS
jgi:AGCS family alanine or glycine:cation symporter